jgi:hypothetical protein
MPGASRSWLLLMTEAEVGLLIPLAWGPAHPLPELTAHGGYCLLFGTASQLIKTDLFILLAE